MKYKKMILTLLVIGFSPLLTSADNTATYQYTRLLKIGSSYGSDVIELQKCLNRLGYSTGIVDGWFGGNTARGVRQFQAANNLMVDGVIGKNTGPKFTNACILDIEQPQTAEPQDSVIPDVSETEPQEEAQDASQDKDKSRVETDGYNVFGDDSAAKASFIFDIENDGNSDITLAGLDAFIFEIDGLDYTGSQLAVLSGYSLNIKVEDEAISGLTAIVLEDGDDVDIEVKVIVDASSTTKGTGEYEIELKRINWSSATVSNGKLHLGAVSNDVDLINS